MNNFELGRVIPLYKGEYVANTTYFKLDCVLYQGSSYLFAASSGSGTPGVSSNWQLLASKGDTGPSGPTGNFGATTASVSILEAGSSAYATVTLDSQSPTWARDVHIDFGIPAGPTGIESVSASASWGPDGSNPSVIPSLESKHLHFDFAIPARSSAETIRVDGVDPEGNDINLQAIRYKEGWTFSSNSALNSELQERARNILNAQITGDYIPATGGTIFNDFNIKSNNMDGQDSSPVSGSRLKFIDTNLSNMGYIYPKQEADGEIKLNIAAYRETNDNSYENSLSLGITNNGESIVSVSNASAWRSALSIMPATSIPSRDVAGGATGDVESFARANHAHPLNIDSTIVNIKSDASTASLGSSTYYALVDHVHPMNYDDENSPAKDSGESGFIGTPNAYALSDHAHPFNVTNAYPVADTGASGAWGSSSYYARSDHAHPFNVATNYSAAPLGATAASGSSTFYARADHVHPFPSATDVGAISSETYFNCLPAQSSIAATPATWSAIGSFWQTQLTIPNTITVNANTVFDLRPDGNLIQQMSDGDVTGLYIRNDGSANSVYLCAVGSTLSTLPTLYFQYYNLR